MPDEVPIEEQVDLAELLRELLHQVAELVSHAHRVDCSAQGQDLRGVLFASVNLSVALAPNDPHVTVVANAIRDIANKQIYAKKPSERKAMEDSK